MIHSLSGGLIHNNKFYNYALVDVEKLGVCWYTFSEISIEVGDAVLVPYGKHNVLTRGVVIRIEKSVMEQTVPFPVNRTKEIYSKL